MRKMVGWVNTREEGLVAGTVVVEKEGFAGKW